jgi:membrane protein DedA with SNARE-associated domain
MPEDIPIVLAGIAASKNIVDTRTIFVTCYFGVLVADFILYFFGYFFGKRLLAAGTKSKFIPYLTDEKVESTRLALRRNRFFYIALGRHFFPVRTVTFLCAGALHISFVEFAIADGLAALISVSLVLGLGVLLGEKLTPEVISGLINQYALYAFAAIVVALFIFYKIRRRRSANAQPH